VPGGVVITFLSPPGTLWVLAFVTVAEGFSPTAGRPAAQPADHSDHARRGGLK